MKKLGINTAAAILDIIGASFYLIALIIAFTAQYYLQYVVAINIVSMIIWYFSLAATIVSLIAFFKSKNIKINRNGLIFSITGHLSYFLLGVYLAPASLVLCILGAIFTFKNNHYLPVMQDKEIIIHDELPPVDVEVQETILDEQEEPIE